MKVTKRVFAMVLCVALILSLATVAFAATTSRVFFTTSNGYGYTIRGTGKIDGTAGTSYLTAWSSSSTPSIKVSDLTSQAYVAIWDSSGGQVGSGWGSYGTDYAEVRLYAKNNVTKIRCEYEHMGKYYGPYTLVA